MDFAIGVDGGGTKTEVVAVDSRGNIIDRANGDATNPHAVTFPAAEANLADVLDKLLDRPALAGMTCRAISLGMAGVETEAERGRFLAYLARYVEARQTSPTIRLYSDAEIALQAALNQSFGIIAIAGTGSIVLGITPDGNRCRTGGWGHVLGDKGSGYEIGLAALQAVMLSYDGVLPATELTELIVSQYGFSTIEDLRTYIYQPHIHKQHIADFASLCVRAAQSGDRTAAGIVTAAAEQLADLTNALRRKNGYFADCPIGAAGSIFKHSGIFRERYASRLDETSPHGASKPDIRLSEFPPAYGAAILGWAAVDANRG